MNAGNVMRALTMSTMAPSETVSPLWAVNHRDVPVTVTVVEADTVPPDRARNAHTTLTAAVPNLVIMDNVGMPVILPLTAPAVHRVICVNTDIACAREAIARRFRWTVYSSAI